MALYACSGCGMTIGTITCGDCGKELVNEVVARPDGVSVMVARCPDGHGKIKSPICCGADMDYVAQD